MRQSKRKEMESFMLLRKEKKKYEEEKRNIYIHMDLMMLKLSRVRQTTEISEKSRGTKSKINNSLLAIKWSWKEKIFILLSFPARLSGIAPLYKVIIVLSNNSAIVMNRKSYDRLLQAQTSKHIFTCWLKLCSLLLSHISSLSLYTYISI